MGAPQPAFWRLTINVDGNEYILFSWQVEHFREIEDRWRDWMTSKKEDAVVVFTGLSDGPSRAREGTISAPLSLIKAMCIDQLE
jgi:hypothetical protein